jgi:hypothetical protein
VNEKERDLNNEVRVYHKQIDWLTLALNHPVLKSSIRMWIRTLYLELFQKVTEKQSMRVRQQGYIEKTSSKAKIDFQGKFFLFHPNTRQKKCATYMKALYREFLKKKNKTHKALPAITRIDGKVGIVTKLEVKEFFPDFSKENVIVGFKYERKPHYNGGGEYEIQTGVELKVGDTWRVCIYDKVIEAATCIDKEKCKEIQRYIDGAGLKDGERLFRIELRCIGGRACSFIEPYFTSERNFSGGEIVNAIFF